MLWTSRQTGHLVVSIWYGSSHSIKRIHITRYCKIQICPFSFLNKTPPHLLRLLALSDSRFCKMALTLKRPIEALGSPHLMEHEPGPMVKRRRCGMSLFPTTPPGINSGPYGFPESGSSSPSSSRHHSLCVSPLSLGRGVKRVKRKLDIDHYSNTPSTPPVSPFLSATPPLETG